MSTSIVASSAAGRRKRSSRKASPYNYLGSAAIAAVMLGCAWTVHANVFGANVYPSLSSASFDAPVIKRAPAVAARSPAAIIDNVFAALPEPAPAISAPATIASVTPFNFVDRFAAAAPQATQATQLAEAPKLASATAPKIAETPKSQDAPKPQVVASLSPAASASLPAARPADAKPAKSAVAAAKDMAQRAKAAVMSIASNEKQTMVEKLWGTPQPKSHAPSLLSFASADASFTGSLGPTRNPALDGSTPRYDQSTAVYDISARTVYLPDGTRLEAHSGLGSKIDDPRYVHVRMHGATPPHVYDLTPREALFHGVPALRLTPVGGEEAIFGRNGLLAHTYMLGPNGDSNGCVSFKDYYAFLNAYRNQGIKRLAVVARID